MKIQNLGYREVAAAAEEAADASKSEDASAAPSNLTVAQVVQRALNQSRKATARHKKAVEEHARCKAQ